MAKIVVYEDGYMDLIDRYAHLTKEHDIHVRHPTHHIEFERPERYRQHGFNPDNFKAFGNPKEDDADLYFLDGLRGLCFQFATELPKDKTFIYSDSREIEDEARKIGLNVVGYRRIEVIVKETLEKK